MRKIVVHLTVVTVTLLSGVSVAAASGGNNMSKSTSMPKDTLTLTSKQQKTAWLDISKHAKKENAPTHFTAKNGAIVPSSLTTYPVPKTVASKVPVLRQDQYALLGNEKLLIVNPNDKKVADVITR